MKKYEKEVQQAYLDNEKAVLKKLEEHYQDALDEINSKIELLLARQDADQQYVVYQVEYQRALKTQIKSILETLQTNEFQTVSEYLTKSYDEGFLGAMYSLQKQGIPLVFPIDQTQVVAAVQHETKLSQNLYTTLGKDITDLQKKIAGEITRGIAGGQMYSEIARNVSNWARIPRNNAMRIARTEAHRIQSKATADAQFKAKEKGADVVKQWDSSLDKRTRKSHRELDGQIRELEEPFEVNGHKAMHPGGFGVAKEDINCRCAILQRARWNLGSDYTKWSADAPIVVDDDGTTQFTIIEAKNYESFKKQYTQATERVREDVQMINDPYQRNRSGQRVIRKSKKDVAEAQVVKAVNKNGQEITFNFEGTRQPEMAEKAKQLLTQLSNEYDTYIFQVKRGASRAAGQVEMDGTMKLSNYMADTVIHEFAHGLASSGRVKVGLADEREIAFMKEITKLRTKYEKACAGNPALDISFYSHASKDEFLAEAFMQKKMLQMGLELPDDYGTDTTYSSMVLELVDKYFKKTPLENIGKSSTIELEDILIQKSVGAKTRNYDVLDPSTGEIFHFAEGTKIQNAQVFAGSGTKKSLHEGVAEGLSEQLGGSPEKWQHCKGDGVLDYHGEERAAEVHWFQEETVGKAKFKVKEWKDEG